MAGETIHDLLFSYPSEQYRGRDGSCDWAPWSSAYQDQTTWRSDLRCPVRSTRFRAGDVDRRRVRNLFSGSAPPRTREIETEPADSERHASVYLGAHCQRVPSRAHVAPFPAPALCLATRVAVATTLARFIRLTASRSTWRRPLSVRFGYARSKRSAELAVSAPHYLVGVR